MHESVIKRVSWSVVMQKAFFEFGEGGTFSQADFEEFVNGEPRLRRTEKVESINPATGETVVLMSPPHILANVIGSQGRVVGFLGFTQIRDGTASVGCEGEGGDFSRMVDEFQKRTGATRREYD